VLIDVTAVGLNFRDLMWALGLLPDEALLDGFSGPSLGLECAGTVRAVGPDVTDLQPGQRVIAIAPAALATAVMTPRRAVMPLPAEIDPVAAATMPVAFITAIYALGHVARLRAGERVLIHGGAGGVGLAAIQYALHRGATVYATAGDPTRRLLLARLGVRAVFNSRSASFYDDVMAATDGEGVDVVLNALSGDLMERSLHLLRPFGRFLEIGKRDFHENTTVGLRPLRHNVAYFAIDIDELAALRPSDAQAVMAELATLIAEGQIRPLPYRRYSFTDASAAFRQMQTSGHIGKIVLIPDQVTQTPGAVAQNAGADADETSAEKDDACVTSRHADGVYIVTGGLTGFGLKTAQWLVTQGARHLALLSRRGPATPGADSIIRDFAAAGVSATAYACDVANPPELEATLRTIRAAGAPIRGVVHAAMVISDAALPAQTTARFEAAMAPKLAGAEALDSLTRNDPLDLFILFSSIAATLGNPGQANYAVANATLAAIATRRQAQGLPGIALCWGPIGDVGYLVDAAPVSSMLETAMGARHLTADEALAALPAALASGLPVVGIANARWDSVCRFLPRIAEALMAQPPAMSIQIGDARALRQHLAALPIEAAQARLVEILQHELAGILRLAPDTLAADRDITDLGVDSLMAVELRICLETRLGIDLPIMSLAGKPTLRMIAARLLKTLLTQAGEPSHATQHQAMAALASQYDDIALITDDVT
jgi:NADPH:quinone reductase-like Zn-dependent oxidoreductase/acyl carrier protein